MIENLMKYDDEVVKKHFVDASKTGLGHYEPLTVDKDYSNEFEALINKIPDKQSIEMGKFLGADSRNFTAELLKQKIDNIFRELKDVDKIQVAGNIKFDIQLDAAVISKTQADSSSKLNTL